MAMIDDLNEFRDRFVDRSGPKAKPPTDERLHAALVPQGEAQVITPEGMRGGRQPETAVKDPESLGAVRLPTVRNRKARTASNSWGYIPR